MVVVAGGGVVTRFVVVCGVVCGRDGTVCGRVSVVAGRVVTGCCGAVCVVTGRCGAVSVRVRVTVRAVAGGGCDFETVVGRARWCTFAAVEWTVETERIVVPPTAAVGVSER